MKLQDLLSEQVIRVPLHHTEKEKIIEELIDLIHQSGKIKDRDLALAKVLERERVMSTGMGEGVAIPHAKTEAVEELAAAFGITRQGVDFAAMDDKPVRLIFLLVGPMDPTGPHLQALSRISRLMHRSEFRDRLVGCPSAAAVLEAIALEENDL
ncbi:MAG: PTS system fructose-specific EIIABC component [bacterium ADurb.Bin478]|nr:MAG: PTS system fructose-specific EIIABC component [bacterium ADurb.Bin478]